MMLTFDRELAASLSPCGHAHQTAKYHQEDISAANNKLDI